MQLFRRDPVKHATAMLRPIMPDIFKVDYYPRFPRPDGRTSSWFQVIFAIGPGNDISVRAHVHELIKRMLPVLSKLKVVRVADQVSIRARRRVPEDPLYQPDHPLMYIECYWRGSAIRGMSERGDFSDWSTQCFTYINQFDPKDPLSRETFEQ